MFLTSDAAAAAAAADGDEDGAAAAAGVGGAAAAGGAMEMICSMSGGRERAQTSVRGLELRKIRIPCSDTQFTFRSIVYSKRETETVTRQIKQFQTLFFFSFFHLFRLQSHPAAAKGPENSIRRYFFLLSHLIRSCNV